MLLDRARGHVVSALDPVGGGVHCSLGGDELDFIVTSTLASQGPPAVGRAMGAGLAHHLGVVRLTNPPPRLRPVLLCSPFAQPSLLGRGSISFVTTGDGSVNNGHFLSAVNMAQYAKHRGFNCPVVFGCAAAAPLLHGSCGTHHGHSISDNDLCISLRGHGWLQQGWIKGLQMPVFKAHAGNVVDVWRATRDAFEHARRTRQPVALVCVLSTDCQNQPATHSSRMQVHGHCAPLWPRGNGPAKSVHVGRGGDGASSPQSGGCRMRTGRGERGGHVP